MRKLIMARLGITGSLWVLSTGSSLWHAKVQERTDLILSEFGEQIGKEGMRGEITKVPSITAIIWSTKIFVARPFTEAPLSKSFARYISDLS